MSAPSEQHERKCTCVDRAAQPGVAPPPAAGFVMHDHAAVTCQPTAGQAGRRVYVRDEDVFFHHDENEKLNATTSVGGRGCAALKACAPGQHVCGAVEVEHKASLRHPSSSGCCNCPVGTMQQGGAEGAPVCTRCSAGTEQLMPGQTTCVLAPLHCKSG